MCPPWCPSEERIPQKSTCWIFRRVSSLIQRQIKTILLASFLHETFFCIKLDIEVWDLQKASVFSWKLCFTGVESCSSLSETVSDFDLFPKTPLNSKVIKICLFSFTPYKVKMVFSFFLHHKETESNFLFNFLIFIIKISDCCVSQSQWHRPPRSISFNIWNDGFKF